MGKKKKNNNQVTAGAGNWKWWQITLGIAAIIFVSKIQDPTDDTLRLLIELVKLFKG
ncbi:hypothetical protein [Zunongwangia pacifica]|uniref:Uncharacterized protein n=1 Tax=Zunongwangia pacifica TaxID=2911062 RepID=A0A9X1ZT78_9FLAO|nr:hypothetical protein [Zunongwangia pacifica]MCL6219564.1 hypothetical protein [Zunongwangia pacifica]